MCRLAAYVGPAITLERFLLHPSHGLMQQSWQPREMSGGTINVDGYGFGWFDGEGRAARYAYPLPIWNDTNLPTLARTLSATAWVASVRGATAPSSAHPANTQPFADDEFLFLHNGALAAFHRGLRAHMNSLLSEEIAGAIAGNTDSEYLFALLRQVLREDLELPPEEGLLRLFRSLEDWTDEPAGLNVVLADGERLYAARHALLSPCPSLYFTTDDDDYPDGLLVASEPLTESQYWQPVPEHHLLVLDPTQPPELIPL